MSDKIDELLDNLDEKIQSENVKMEVVDKAEKKLAKIPDATKTDKKKVRRKIRKIKKIIGQDTTSTGPAGKKENAKAKGTGGGNKDNLRCYIRYNNMGNPYRTCNDKVGLEKPKKPSVITPSIPADEFAEKFGGYSNLSDEQTATYHRLFMREKREKEQALSTADDGVEAYRLMRLKEKQKKVEKKEKELKEKLENKEEYKKQLLKLGSQPNKITIDKLKKKYKQPLRSKKVKAIKEDIKDEKELKEDLEKDIKKQIKVVKEAQKKPVVVDFF